jgi:16S rRNA (cytidine1402-2'-O)-methyltransferase
MSTLYLVATPIGNLEDISPRALDTLRGVSLIAAEDTRTAKQLLTHFEIHTPVTSFFEHSKSSKVEHILDALDREDVAVVSEAGMPGINDPGYELVQGAIERGHKVSPIPGPSAVLTALVASGISANSFYYVGFLPRVAQQRRRMLRELASETQTIVAFETPHRLREALKDMETVLGGTRRICAARELTKVFEEFQRGTVAEVRAHFEANEPRGEFTLVVEGRTVDERRTTDDGRFRQRRREAKDERVWDEKRVKVEFGKMMKQGVPRTEAVKRIAKTSGWERQRVYQATLSNGRAGKTRG